jgi:hypothetical protein
MSRNVEVTSERFLGKQEYAVYVTSSAEPEK